MEEQGTKGGQSYQRKRVACSICNKTFSQTSNLKAHLLIHNGDKPFPCDICQKDFISEKRRREHHQRTHEKRRYQCDICHKTTTRKSTLTLHKQTHQECQKCEICGHSVSKPQMRFHMLGHTMEQGVQCEKCGKVFIHRRSLNVHLKQTHGSQGAHHQCQKCGKAFKLKGTATKHEARCSSKKPDPLSLEVKEEIDDDPMQEPEITIEIDSSEIKLELHYCPQCSQEFDTESEMDNHVANQVCDTAYITDSLVVEAKLEEA